MFSVALTSAKINTFIGGKNPFESPYYTGLYAFPQTISYKRKYHGN
jgi:hypothetical protein